MKRFISYLIFYIIQFTWGILMNVYGVVVALFMLITLHKPHKLGCEIYFVCKKLEGFGMEAGIFFVVGADCAEDKYMLCHESGHTIQNFIFGIFTPFISFIPSFIRFWYREIKYYRKGLSPKTDYDAVWFEGTATKWGYKYFEKVYDRKFDN